MSLIDISGSDFATFKPVSLFCSFSLSKFIFQIFVFPKIEIFVSTLVSDVDPAADILSILVNDHQVNTLNSLQTPTTTST